MNSETSKLLMSAPRPPVQSEVSILRPLIEPGSIVVDVGSNQGCFYSSFLDSGCQVFSIEPNLRNVLYQQVRYADFVASGALTIYHHGCSDTEEHAILMINDDFRASISSFDPRWKSQHSRDAYANGLQEQHQLVRLDNLLRPHFEQLGRGFGLLKIDTEGFDLKVLRSYFSGEVPLPNFTMFELHTSQSAIAAAYSGVELLVARGFDRFRMLVHHGSHVLADSTWLTHQQLLGIRFEAINGDSFGFGASVRHGNIIATTSYQLAEAEMRHLSAPLSGAAQW